LWHVWMARRWTQSCQGRCAAAADSQRRFQTHVPACMCMHCSSCGRRSARAIVLSSNVRSIWLLALLSITSVQPSADIYRLANGTSSRGACQPSCKRLFRNCYSCMHQRTAKHNSLCSLTHSEVLCAL
jgi:hypothetical protein